MYSMAHPHILYTHTHPTLTHKNKFTSSTYTPPPHHGGKIMPIRDTLRRTTKSRFSAKSLKFFNLPKIQPLLPQDGPQRIGKPFCAAKRVSGITCLYNSIGISYKNNKKYIYSSHLVYVKIHIESGNIIQKWI